MASLNLSFSDLYGRVAKFLGTYRDSGPSGTDLVEAKDYVHSGYRRFLTAKKEGWSFLNKNYTLSTESGVWEYELPEDFKEMIMPFRFAENSGYPDMDQRSEGEIRQLIVETNSSSYPQYFAIRTGDYTPEAGQRYEATFWPPADTVYVLSYTYKYIPPKLSGDNDLHVGGPEFSEVIKEFCLAAAETEADDVAAVHENIAQRLLAEALQSDKSRNPVHLGYNGDYAGITQREIARGSFRVNDVNFVT